MACEGRELGSAIVVITGKSVCGFGINVLQYSQLKQLIQYCVKDTLRVSITRQMQPNTAGCAEESR